MDQKKKNPIRELHPNIWAVSLTSFFMDISSEMVLNILPLFLSSVLGVKTNIIGIIEGVAEATSSVLKVFSGWLSDKLRSRKWLAVAGYGISALAKPFFYLASSWEAIGAIRWADRVGKGVRTAPRDALVADNVKPEQRGLAFGLHRAADTAGAMLGILIAALVVWKVQASGSNLQESTFRTIVLISIIPAVLAVISLAVMTKEKKPEGVAEAPKISFRGLGKNFLFFMIIVGIFDLGNSSDAFLVLRAQERGQNWSQEADHRRLDDVRADLPWLCAGAKCDPYLVALRGLWSVLRHGIWHCQGNAFGPGAQGFTWHCLWHL